MGSAIDQTGRLATFERAIRPWLDDARVVALCLARPANAATAAATGRPLSAGVVQRWPVATGYRQLPSHALDALLEAIRTGGATNLVVCGLDGGERVIVGPLWGSVEVFSDRDASRSL